jgi:hypothetical protein
MAIKIKIMVLFLILLVGIFVMLSDLLVVRKFMGCLGVIAAPGYSRCHRCGMPWKFCREHSTRYTDGQGCFPLCEKCWQELETPGNRLPYYRELWEEWNEQLEIDPERWEQIKSAVMAGN